MPIMLRIIQFYGEISGCEVISEESGVGVVGS